METLLEIRDSLGGPSPREKAKQFHAMPEAEVVDRTAFLLDRCRGRWVLDIGASGPLHSVIKAVAKKYQGIDRYAGDGVIGMDLDDVTADFPKFWGVEVVICGEVLEHLSNPGYFLDRLNKTYALTTIFTTPNAYSDVARNWALRGQENVNIDHIAWHSPRTLRTLLGRHGYTIDEFYWYRGRPGFSEGMIAVCHSKG